MVLASLGEKLTGALSQLGKHQVLDEAVVDGILKDIVRALIEADVNIGMVRKMREQIKKKLELEQAASQGFNHKRVLQSIVVKELQTLLTPDAKPFVPKRGKDNVIMFVGLQGSGKTTTVTKYALYYQKKGWKVAVVCADTFRAGAYDQLKQNCTKAKIDIENNFYGSLTETDPVIIAAEGVDKFKKANMDMIIVDTSGRHKQEVALFEEMQQVAEAVKPKDIVFVLDSSIGQAAQEQAQAFQDAVSVGSVIVTKLDGHPKGGGALSAVAATGSPITFIGTGEHFDEFEAFNATGFVSRLVGGGDIDGLVEKMKTAGMDQNAKLYKKLQEGSFTMRDMSELLQSFMKMGPMSNIMEMMPGMPKGLLEGVDTTRQFKTFLTIMDSMTEKELDNGQVKKMMCPSRVQRLARGSGRHPAEVEQLLTSYNQFEQTVSKIGKHRFKQMAKDPTSLMRGGQFDQLAKAVDPRILQQMGGKNGLQNMMKRMTQGGGMPGMPPGLF